MLHPEDQVSVISFGFFVMLCLCLCSLICVFFFIVLPSVVACNNKHNCDFPKVVVSDLALQRLVNIIDNVENKKLSTNISVVE